MAKEKSATAKPEQTSDLQLVRNLAAILDETGLSEIEIEQNGVRVRVSRGTIQTWATAAPASPSSLSPSPEPSATPLQAGAAGLALDPATHPGTVKSPMVGTAYLASSPGSQPFVEVGSKVKQGDTMLIIEAMKTMNHIPAPRPGTIKQIFVSDGQPVEYGEPLLIID